VASPELRISGEQVTAYVGRRRVGRTSVPEALARLAGLEGRGPGLRLLPRGVRVWYERGDAVAVAVEVAPQCRTLRWLAEDSKKPFGPGARYREYFLAFPWVVLLLVLRGGMLTGYQQLYYRKASLDAGEELLLPNLPNVAEGYGQRCWVCLQMLQRAGPLAFETLIAKVVEHVYTAAFNKSSEVHEGNSWFGAMRDLDPRVASPAAWEAATRQNRAFPLEVEWRPAGTTATRELAAMLDRVVAPARPRNAADLATLLVHAAAGSEGAE
jgi:hypothetical protein